MARQSNLAALSNPLVSSEQLLKYRNNQEASHNSDTKIFRVNLLTQTAGILLRLPQEVIATSIVLLQRHMIVTSSNNTLSAILLTDNTGDGYHPESTLITTISASIFLAAKQSFYPLSPRSIVNVLALLTSTTSSIVTFINPSAPQITSFSTAPDPQTYYVSEGTYQSRREKLFTAEKAILISLGFDAKAVLPYNLALTYLQALSASASDIVERVLAHLNAALLSPQFLYLTHQPNVLAVGAIYLAAREQGVTLVDDEVAWWEVFDVGREELGFLVLSMASMDGFVKAQELENTATPTPD